MRDSPNELKTSFIFFHTFKDLELLNVVRLVEKRCKFENCVLDFDFDWVVKDGLEGSHFLDGEEDISNS